MFQAVVLVHNIVTSVWHIYFCCTALCCLLLCFYSIVTHSKAGNCHFDVSGFYREAKYLHFLPIFDNLIKGTQRQLSAILRPKIENLDPFLVESSPISFFADCILSNTFTEHYCPAVVLKPLVLSCIPKDWDGALKIIFFVVQFFLRNGILINCVD